MAEGIESVSGRDIESIKRIDVELEKYRENLTRNLRRDADALIKRIELAWKMSPQDQLDRQSKDSPFRTAPRKFWLSVDTIMVPYIDERSGAFLGADGQPILSISWDPTTQIKGDGIGYLYDAKGNPAVDKSGAPIHPVIKNADTEYFRWNSFYDETQFRYDGEKMSVWGKEFPIRMDGEKVVFIANMINSLSFYALTAYAKIGNMEMWSLQRLAAPVCVEERGIVFKGTINDTVLYAGNKLTQEEKQKVVDIVNDDILRQVRFVTEAYGR